MFDLPTIHRYSMRMVNIAPGSRKILIVTPLIPPESGGPAYYSVALQAELTKLGHEVSLIAFHEVRKYPRGIRHLLFLYKALFASLHVDTLIILDTVSVALPAVLAGWVLGKHTIIRTGGDFVWEHFVERTGEKVLLSEFYTAPRALDRTERLLVWLQKHIIFPLTTTIVFSSTYQRDVWAQPYAIPPRKTAIIENSYPEKNFTAKGGEIFLCAWRPTGFKNIDTLEKAYALAKEKHPAIQLQICKDIPREELQARMRHARALVVPSLSEVSPNMAMEALAMGLPVILTKDCGTKDRFNDAVSWIDPKDPQSIADTLCAFMDKKTYQDAKHRAEEFSFTRTYTDVAHDFIPHMN
jgi:glycosyltransferase involved in cell wall biosynthesis